MIRDAAIAIAAFVVVTVVAELLGAVDLGTALAFGSMAFMAAIVGTILARGRSVTEPPPERPAARGRRGKGAQPEDRRPRRR